MVPLEADVLLHTVKPLWTCVVGALLDFRSI